MVLQLFGEVSPVALHDAAGRQARLRRAGAGRGVAREARGAALRGGRLGPRAGQFAGLPAQDQCGRPDQRVAAEEARGPGRAGRDLGRLRNPLQGAEGEKVVAAECVSRLSDRHYGQWLTLHKPFRRCLDLVDEAQLAKVPPQYRYLAMAYLNGYGADDAEVDRELKVEGHSRAAAQSIRDMLAANLALIQDYLAGRIREAPAPAAAALEGRAGREAVAYNSQQRRFKTLLDAAVARSLLARSADEGEAEAEARASGTGKTTVCHDKIEEILGGEKRPLALIPWPLRL